MKKHNKLMIIGQVIFVAVVLAGIYFAYPRTDISVTGNVVEINSANAKVIIISENPDFSNPWYVDTRFTKNISFKLAPGKYYWKADNGLIEGVKNEFEIKSEVGLGIERDEDSELVNVGNVKLNITKSKGGVMIGQIILGPGKSEEIEDKDETYTGEQTE